MDRDDTDEQHSSPVAVILIDFAGKDEDVSLLTYSGPFGPTPICRVIRTRWAPDSFRAWTGISAESIHDGAPVEPNSVYLMAPDRYFRIQEGRFAVCTPLPVSGSGDHLSEEDEISGWKSRSGGREQLPMEAVADVSGDAVIGTTPQGTVEHWNHGAEKMYGYPAGHMIGFSMEALCHEKDVHKWRQRMDTLAAGETVAFDDCRRIANDGSTLDVATTASPIINEHGSVVGISLVEHDVTEFKEIEQGLRRYSRQLEEANRDLETFSYSISHDLRAPLRAIDGYARIVLEDYADALDQDGQQLLDSIHCNAVKMARLIDDLLEFSRMGRQEMRTGPVDMHRLALEAVEECLRESERAVSVDVDELPWAEGDRSMLRLVLLNLIDNALKYSAKCENPAIRIGAEHHALEATYFVRDNGVGFDMREADRLFGVFQRLHDNREFQGTGLGLAIVSRVIARHGGRIWGESEKNSGATFYFTLPAPA